MKRTPVMLNPTKPPGWTGCRKVRMTANILEGGQGDLEVTDGTVRFAYNDRQDPWHRLGVPMSDDACTPELMLSAARANFTVSTRRVIATDEQGLPLYNIVEYVNDDGETDVRTEYVYVDDSRATVREDLDGRFQGLSTVGTRYTATQNEEVLIRALAIVDATDGEAVVDTVGVMDDGRQFFACVDLGKLSLTDTKRDDEADVIHRYLVVRNSHDGTTPIMFMNSDIRAVCKNTVMAGTKRATASGRIFKARHTVRSVRDLLHDEGVLKDARNALKLSVEWSQTLKAAAQELMGVKLTKSGVDKFLEELFPLSNADLGDRWIERNYRIRSTITGLYHGPTNAGVFGENAWSMSQAVGEYFDHFREGSDADARAITSLELGSVFNEKKIEVNRMLLSGAFS